MTNQDDNHRQTVGEWLSRPFEWRIPVYQRHYAWDASNESGPIHLLWGTVERQVKARLNHKDKAPKQHYLGAVIVDDKTERGVPDGITRYDVVDGQQRLTTIQLALFALAKVARDDHQYGEIWEKLKSHVFHKGKEPRLRPTNFDNWQFKEVLFKASGDLIDIGEQDGTRVNAKKSKVTATCRYFEGVINDAVQSHAEHQPRAVIDAIFTTLLDGFGLVLIVLDPEDDAQGIFESLNSYAQPLTTFDLIRNNVFRRAAELDERGRDERLFNSRDWQMLEEHYWEGKADGKKKDGQTHIEAYVARMLVATMEQEVLFGRNEIFKTYQKFSRKFSSIEEEVKALGRYTSTYRYLDSVSDGCPKLPKVDCGVFRHHVWQSRIFYPVIFSIAGSDASVEEKAKMVKLLESYVIRRGVCGLKTNHYNKHVVTICKELANNASYDTLNQVLKGAKTDTAVFPNDERVKGDCITAKFYGTLAQNPFQYYVFKKLELLAAADRAERGDFDVETLDHILPQAWEKDPGWVKAMEETDPLVVPTYIDTIGNLTPMSFTRNPAKSNHPWDECKGLLEISPMALNRELAKKETWGIKQIRERSELLADRICKIWPYDIS